MKIKIGIFFGGTSRLRERSFALGRTVYNYLNRTCFEPIPIFVDSLENIILLDWQKLYQDGIRDFFPPPELLRSSPNQFQIYLESLGEMPEEELDRMIAKVGRRIKPQDLPQLISFAFLAMPGERGALQKRLEQLRIPYTGSHSQLCAALGDQATSLPLLRDQGFLTLRNFTISRRDWLESDADELFQLASANVGFPMTIRPSGQSASGLVARIGEDTDLASFREAVDAAFGCATIPVADWLARSDFDRVDYLKLITHGKDGLSFPLIVSAQSQDRKINHPDDLLKLLNSLASEVMDEGASIRLASVQASQHVTIREMDEMDNFNCLVLSKDDGSPVAMLPEWEPEVHETEPMPPRIFNPEQSAAIRSECEKVFASLGLQAYGALRGYIDINNRIYFDQVYPNPEPFLPKAILHAGSVVGMGPSELLNYFIRRSLAVRAAENPQDNSYSSLLEYLDETLRQAKPQRDKQSRVALFFGGYGHERDLTLLTARTVYEVLAGSEEYEPIPVLLSGTPGQWTFHQVPGDMLFLPTVDVILQAIQGAKVALSEVELLRKRSAELLIDFTDGKQISMPEMRSLDDLGQIVDQAFIALQGRPGEDGKLQAELDARNIPYNGSGVKTSQVAVSKLQTMEVWKRNGFLGPEQVKIARLTYDTSPQEVFQRIEEKLTYPLVAKPVDQNGGLSVKILRSRLELEAYTGLGFRGQGPESTEQRRTLKLKPKQYFPSLDEILFESLVLPQGARQFFELSATVLCSPQADGNFKYDVLDLAEIPPGRLNPIIPARLGKSPQEFSLLTNQVKSDLEKAARILNLRGLATIDCFVRVYDTATAETILLECNTLPPLHYGHPVLLQTAQRGLSPYGLVEKLLRDSKGYRGAEPSIAGQDEAITTVPVATASLPDTLPTAAPIISAAPVVTTPEPVSVPRQELPQGVGSGVNERFKEWFNEVIGFFVSGIFIKNLLALGVFGFLLYLLATQGIKWYTMHGTSVQVQDYRGMRFTEARMKARQGGFKVVISDSTSYDPTKPAYYVFKQDPQPLSRVKENRTIYLVINPASASAVPLPALKGGNDNYDTYARALNYLGIRAVVMDTKYDKQLEDNTILYMEYRGRKITRQDLQSGIQVPKGSTIKFVVSKRNTGMVPIPDVVCQQYDAASLMVSASGLKLLPETDDGFTGVPLSYFVYRQEPAFHPDSTMRSGGDLKLFLTKKRPENCPTEKVEPEGAFEEQ